MHRTSSYASNHEIASISCIINAMTFAHYTYRSCLFAEADTIDAAPPRKGDAEFERQLAMALMATEHQASAPAGPGISLDRTAIVEVRCFEGRLDKPVSQNPTCTTFADEILRHEGHLYVIIYNQFTME